MVNQKITKLQRVDSAVLLASSSARCQALSGAREEDSASEGFGSLPVQGQQWVSEWSCVPVQKRRAGLFARAFLPGCEKHYVRPLQQNSSLLRLFIPHHSQLRLCPVLTMDRHVSLKEWRTTLALTQKSCKCCVCVRLRLVGASCGADALSYTWAKHDQLSSVLVQGQSPAWVPNPPPPLPVPILEGLHGV